MTGTASLLQGRALPGHGAHSVGDDLPQMDLGPS